MQMQPRIRMPHLYSGTREVAYGVFIKKKKKALHHTGKVEESVGKASACRMGAEVTIGQEKVQRVNKCSV